MTEAGCRLMINDRSLCLNRSRPVEGNFYMAAGLVMFCGMTKLRLLQKTLMVFRGFLKTRQLWL
jgi:hypothetical protein